MNINWEIFAESPFKKYRTFPVDENETGHLSLEL